MNYLKKKRRIQIIVILFISLATASILIGYGLRDGISYFMSPTDLITNNPKSDKLIRVGGLVEKGSVSMKNDGEINFLVTDGNESILVNFKGILPDLFSEGQGMIGKGYYVNKIFNADEILAKHDEKYMPIEVINILKEEGTYRTPNLK